MKTWSKRCIVLFLSLALVLGISPAVTPVAAVNNYTWAEQELDGSTVTVATNITVSGTVRLTAPITIAAGSGTVTIEGINNGMLLRGEHFKSGNMLNIESGAVILKNIIIDGNGENDLVQTESIEHAGISMTGGTLTLDSGTILRNHHVLQRTGITSSSNPELTCGSAIRQTGGTITMKDGCQIINNRSFSFGNIYVGRGAEFRMDGGLVKGNGQNTVDTVTRGGGGGFHVAGTLTMGGGEITGNDAGSADHTNSRGGGIFNNGTVTLTGGTIHDNIIGSNGGLGENIFVTNGSPDNVSQYPSAVVAGGSVVKDTESGVSVLEIKRYQAAGHGTYYGQVYSYIAYGDMLGSAMVNGTPTNLVAEPTELASAHPGEEFKYWVDDSSGTAVRVYPYTLVTKNMLLYPVYEQKGGTSISSAQVILKDDVPIIDGAYQLNWTGRELRPEIDRIVLPDGAELTDAQMKGWDFVYEYTDNVEVGDAAVRVKAVGAIYSGTATTTFRIVGHTIAEATVTAQLNGSAFTAGTRLAYSDAEQKPVVTSVKVGTATLIPNQHYTVAYQMKTTDGAGNPSWQTAETVQAAGDYRLHITGSGGYSGSVDLEFSIVGTDISGATVVTDYNDSTPYQYQINTPHSPEITSVTLNGATLTAGDYTTGYEKWDAAAGAWSAVARCVEAGKYRLVLTGKGRYYGSARSGEFVIEGTDISGATVAVDWSGATPAGSGTETYYVYEFDNQTHRPEVTSVTLSDNTELRSGDYEVNWQIKSGDNWSNTEPTDPGAYRIIVTGRTNYTGSIDLPFSIGADVGASTVEFTGASVDKYTYDGAAHKPTVSASLRGKMLVEDSNYRIQYEKQSTDESGSVTWAVDASCINAGKYRVAVVGMSDAGYTGAAYKEFEIEKTTTAVQTPPEAATGLVYDTNAQRLLTSAGAATNSGVMEYGIQTKKADGTDATEWKTEIADVTATDAGSYTVMYRVKEDENHYGTDAAELTVTIAKASGVITTPPQAKTGLGYTNTDQALVDTAGMVANGTVQYRVKQGSSGTWSAWSADIPKGKDAATYTVEYGIKDDPNCTDSTVGTLSVTIGKAVATVTAAPEGAGNLEDTGSEQSLLTSEGQAENGTMQYRLGESGDIKTTHSAITAKNAGNYIVYYRALGNTNYENSAWASISVTIKSTVNGAPTAQSLTYDSTQRELVTAGDGGSSTVYYRVTAAPAGETTSNEWSADIPKGTNAGSYTVEFVAATEQPASTVTAAGSVIVTINKAPPIITAPSANNRAYTGREAPLLTGGSVEDNAGTFYYSETGADNSWSPDIPEKEEAGDYVVYYKVIGDANHTDTEPVRVDVNIGKTVAVVATAPAAILNLTYNGSPQALVTAGATDGTQSNTAIWYKLSTETTWKTTVPTATNAGAYHVEYKAAADESGTTPYSDSAVGEVVVTIAKADSSLSGAPAAKELTYSGSPQDLVTAGGAATGGTVQYRLGAGGAWQDAVPTATAAGDYTVYYKVTGDANHNDYVPESPIPVTISRKEIAESDVTVDTADKVYDRTAQEPEVKITGLEKNTDFTVTYVGNLNVGRATVTVQGIGNYTGTVTKTFQITAVTIAESDVTYTNGTLSYNGADQTPGISVSVSSAVLVPGTDYTVTYQGSGGAAVAPREVGTYTVTIAGTGNYTGSVTKTFSITQIDLSSANVGTDFAVTPVSFTYNGEAQKPVVRYNGNVMTEGTDYDAVYQLRNTDGSATGDALSGAPANAGNYILVSITGKGGYSATEVTLSTAFDIAPIDLNSAVMRFPSSPYAYGSTVNDGAYTLSVAVPATYTGGDNYTVSYTRGGSAVTPPFSTSGTYYATIQGIGPNVTGSASASFVINSYTPPSNPGGNNNNNSNNNNNNYSGGGSGFSGGGGGGGGGGGRASEEPAAPATPATPSGTTEAGAPAASYADIGMDSWYYDAVDFVSSRNLMNGIGDGQFSPDSNAARAMVVTILYRLDGEPESAPDSFDDVPGGEYYSEAVAWAVENGIVYGYGDKSFGPGDDVTREQFLTILYRYAELRGCDVAGRGDLSRFSDRGEISEYALEVMQWAVGAGLVEGNGYGELMPGDTATRAQIAAILQRFCLYVLPAEPAQETA